MPASSAAPVTAFQRTRAARGQLRADSTGIGRQWIHFARVASRHVQSPNSIGDASTVAALEDFFLQQAAVLREVAPGQASSTRAADIMPLNMAIAQTCHAMSALARGGFTNDVWMLSRALLERVINACYLLVCDDAEFKRYMAHTKRRALSALDRSIETEVGAVRIAFQGEVKPPADIAEIQSLFLRKNGRVFHEWSETSPVDRVVVIAQRSDIPAEVFLLALATIYRDSSEALHGTLYGVTFHLGLFSPGTSLDSKEALEKHLLGYTTTLFWLLGILVFQLNRQLTAPESDARRRAREAFQSARSRITGVLGDPASPPAHGDGDRSAGNG